MKPKVLIIAIVAFFTYINAYAQNEVTVRSFKEIFSDLSARTNPRYDINTTPCALIKVQYPLPGATFEGNVIGDVEYRNNEYWVYVSHGTKRIKVHLPATPSITVEFIDYDILQIESNITYVLEFQRSGKKVDFHPYIEAGYTIGSTSGVELSLGGYISNFNVELNYMIPMVASQTIYWNHVSQPSAKASYKPTMILGGRVGYRINIMKNLRVTPQIGMKFLKTAETMEIGDSKHASGSYCSSLVAGCKVQYMLSKNFGLSLTPEYDAPISKSKGFKALSDVSSDIKKWNNGFGIRVAVDVEF